MKFQSEEFSDKVWLTGKRAIDHDQAAWQRLVICLEPKLQLDPRAAAKKPGGGMETPSIVAEPTSQPAG